jgi:hypothetical protein
MTSPSAASRTRAASSTSDAFALARTLDVNEAVRESGLSKRELVRRLGTSATQLYRLLDPTNYTKSVDQLLVLLRVLGKQVEVVVR